MRAKVFVTVLVLAAAAIAASGCSLSDARNASPARLFAGNPLAPNQAIAAGPDSIPGHHPPPPPPPKQYVTVQFAGADSVAPGQTSSTRWQFANSGHSSILVDWTLTDEHGWPGFPKQGTVDLAAQSTQLLVVVVAVPDSAASGSYPLHMLATPRRGATATADGAIQVFGGSPPPDSVATGLR